MGLLTNSYDLAMQQYRNMQYANASTKTVNEMIGILNGNRNDIKAENNISNNLTTEVTTEKLEQEFKDKVQSAITLNTNNAASVVKPSNNSSTIKFNTTVKALSDSKVQATIKKYGIDEIVSQAAKKYDLPESLIYKVIETESYFNVNDVSWAGASGLMQLMPATAADEGVTDIFDPYQNIMAGCSQLRKHINRFNGDLKLALAAYNAGPGNVIKYGGVPPFKETQNYVKKILG